MEKKAEWGFVLKKLREERGLTQEELAARSPDVTRAYIAKAELGNIDEPSHDKIKNLAIGLRMSEGELDRQLFGKGAGAPPRDALESARRLAVELQSVPIYTEFPVHAGAPVSIMDYAYLSTSRAVAKNMLGFPVRGECLEPDIKEGDVVIIDREGTVNPGDIVICIIDGELHLGRLRKIASELWLENNQRKYRSEDCQSIVPVVRIERRLR